MVNQKKKYRKFTFYAMLLLKGQFFCKITVFCKPINMPHHAHVYILN